jgi:glycosyltransferase involved in cell wall biosynthesis
MARRKPFVSIVIPLYNKADFILKTIASAASQIRVELEIIVIDDGSTDGGARLVKIADLPCVRLIEQANAGVSRARNHGVALAEGKWIAFLDADDLWTCDHLVGLLHAVEGHDAIAAFSNVRLESRGGGPLIDRKVVAQRIDDYFSFALSNRGYPIGVSAIMVRRDQLLAAGLFAEGITTGEDIDMWCRLACRGPFFYNARLSATYNDAHTALWRIAHPLFARRLPQLIRDGTLPPILMESSKRYVNFLLLEYARQLLDDGRYAEARAVLLNDCDFSYDSWRFLKRLARTSSVGQTLFYLSRAAARQA